MRPSNPTFSPSQTNPSRRSHDPMADTGDHADIATITEAADLLAWLLSYLDLQEPRIPLDDEARNTIADFCLAIRTGTAPEHMPLFVWDGFNNVAWHALNDDEAPRHGLPLVQFVHLCAVGLSGLLPLGIEGVAEPESIPFGRLFDMIFHVEPKLREWLRVRRAGKDGYLITTTAKGRERLGQRVRVAVRAMNCLPPDEVFDLAVPYTEAKHRAN